MNFKYAAIILFMLAPVVSTIANGVDNNQCEYVEYCN